MSTNQRTVLYLAFRDLFSDHGGGRLYSREMLGHYLVHFQQVHVVGVGDNALSVPDEVELDGGLTAKVQRLPAVGGCSNMRSLMSMRPLAVCRYWDRSAQQALNTLADEISPDVVVVDHRLMIPFLFGLKKHFDRTAVNPRWIYQSHNAEVAARRSMVAMQANWLRRMVVAWDSVKSRRWEDRCLRTVQAVSAIAAEDITLMQQDHPGLAVTWEVIPPAMKGLQALEVRPKVARLLLIGSFIWQPKLLNARWFIAEIAIPLLRQYPHLTATIAGKEAGNITKCFVIPSDVADRLEVINSPPDMAPILAVGGIAVIPERQAGGLKLKGLEAALLGLPIVSTGSGVAGLGIDPGEHYLLADSAADFRQAISNCLVYPEDTHRRAMTCRDRVTEYLAPERTAERFSSFVDSWL